MLVTKVYSRLLHFLKANNARHLTSSCAEMVAVRILLRTTRATDEIETLASGRSSATLRSPSLATNCPSGAFVAYPLYCTSGWHEPCRVVFGRWSIFFLSRLYMFGAFCSLRCLILLGFFRLAAHGSFRCISKMGHREVWLVPVMNFHVIKCIYVWLRPGSFAVGVRFICSASVRFICVCWRACCFPPIFFLWCCMTSFCVLRLRGSLLPYIGNVQSTFTFYKNKKVKKMSETLLQFYSRKHKKNTQVKKCSSLQKKKKHEDNIKKMKCSSFIQFVTNYRGTL